MHRQNFREQECFCNSSPEWETEQAPAEARTVSHWESALSTASRLLLQAGVKNLPVPRIQTLHKFKPRVRTRGRSDLQLQMLKGSLGTAVEQRRGCNQGGCWREGGRTKRGIGRNLCTLDPSGRRNGRGTRLKGSRTKNKSNVKAWQKGGTSEGCDIEGVFKGSI